MALAMAVFRRRACRSTLALPRACVITALAFQELVHEPVPCRLVHAKPLRHFAERTACDHRAHTQAMPFGHRLATP